MPIGTSDGKYYDTEAEYLLDSSPAHQVFERTQPLYPADMGRADPTPTDATMAKAITGRFLPQGPRIPVHESDMITKQNIEMVRHGSTALNSEDGGEDKVRGWS